MNNGKKPRRANAADCKLGHRYYCRAANSAVESVVDRIGSERHALSGRAKDFGSAAVLCAIVLAAMVWLSLGLS
jgi:diacylglycerol kinase